MQIRNRHLFRCVALLAALLLPAFAQAAKEKFVRDKPHVNIGTIGHVDNSSESLSLTLSLVGLPTSGDSAGPSLMPRCSGSFDIRILESSALDGPAVFERRVELEQNRSHVSDVPRQDFTSPLLYEVTAQGEYIDGRHCVFRGLIEVQSDVAATRAIPLLPEDFILLGKPERPLRRP